MIYIGNVPLDHQIPKICVPLVAKTLEALQEECQYLQGCLYDVVEFRADFLQHLTRQGVMTAALSAIRRVLPDSPLLVTVRTAAEGGEISISADAYAALLRQALQSGMIDALDIEYVQQADVIEPVIRLAKEKGVPIIMSSHDFQKTPPFEELTKRLLAMKKRGADVAKLACMPQCADDVLTLLRATAHVKSLYPDEPLITMSMGHLGVVSRISGEIFGSAMTFGAARKASAPGQLEVSALQHILQVLHGAPQQ